MTTSANVHHVVSVTQEDRQFASFWCRTICCTDDRGNQVEFNLMSKSPLVTAVLPMRVCDKIEEAA